MTNLEEMRAELACIRREVHRTGADRLWTVAGRAATTLALPGILGLSSWLSSLADRVQLNADRLTRIEGNRFTSEDGRKLVEQIRDELRTHYPPEWLRQAITRLENQTNRLGEKLDALDDRLDLVEIRTGKEKDK